MNVALRVFAGIIDFFQFFFLIIMLAFQVMTPVGGAAVGGFSGAILCWKASSGVFEGLMNAAACATGGGLAGGVLSAFATPIGIAVDIAVSCTFGALLIALLGVSGRFYLMPVALCFAGEMAPGVNAFAPFWSILAHRCITRYNREHGGPAATKRETLGFLFGGAQMGTSSLKGAAYNLGYDRGMAAERQAATIRQGAGQSARIPLQTKSFEGVRKAPNDPYAAAA